MLFNSYTFIIFLAVVLLLSRQIGSWTVRKFFLLIASYLFYATWNPPFVLLLWISTIVDWVLARKIHTSDTKRARNLLLIASLCVNLGMLGFFKYGTFLVDNFISLLHIVNIEFNPVIPDIVLPVGISFYTFQTLSYTIDIYRGKMKPWHSFLDYALYVTFFPQLVAGPIVRATHFLPQCVEEKKGSTTQLDWGLTLFAIGLFSKVVVADGLMAPVVARVYDAGAIPGFMQAWIGTFAFSTEIFCDFAGYSSCAIGLALCLGFVVPVNFRYPYASVGFSEFWTRWHISLSSWLRDYLYISMGGNRHGEIRTYINLMLTMLLGGLWHGASWLFAIWGGLNGLYLIGERLIQKTFLARYCFWDKRPAQIGLAMVTYILAIITMVFARAPSLDRALTIVYSMLGLHPSSVKPELSLTDFQWQLVAICTTVMLIIHHLFRNTSLEEVGPKLHWSIRAGIISVLVYFTMISFTGADRAFFYFQF